jgi:hypothetical protein
MKRAIAFCLFCILCAFTVGILSAVIGNELTRLYLP